MIHSERFVPKSIEEAVSLLSEYGERAKIIAGGTDLLVQIKKRVTLPDYLISIEGIQGLDYIIYDKKDGLRIGPLVTIRSITNSSMIKSRFNILYQAAGTLGTPTIRSQATIGGNLCNAAPSADIAPPLIVLGTSVKIEGVEGGKTLSVEDFFTGPGETALRGSRMLTGIRIPNLPPTTGSAYIKQTRTKGADLAIVGVAALVVMDGEVIKDAKIALGAVAPTPIRAKKAEKTLKGEKPDDKLLEECGRAASVESRPIDDIRSSADYRKKLVTVLVKRAVRQAIEQI